ncbi:hypothetical protein CSPAE12_11872, partial [Colletotrichum incanum]
MARTDPPTRAVILALRSRLGGKTADEVAQGLGIPKRTVNNILLRAKKHGFDPTAATFTLRPEYINDAPQPGRPKKATETVADIVVSKVCRDRYGREKTCADIAGEIQSEQGIDISASTVYRILRHAGFRKTKPTRKPGLTAQMKQQRLNWCLAHRHWTLEDWKKVVWSDETSVVLNHRRGSYRLWRRAYEAYTKSCIRGRWKGYSEFMFWACFTYDKKGPCHCWATESAAEKKAAAEEVERLNRELEP